MTTEEKLARAKELLGTVADLAINRIGIIDTTYCCKHCGNESGKLPLRHYHNCLVEQCMELWRQL